MNKNVFLGHPLTFVLYDRQAFDIHWLLIEQWQKKPY